MIHDLAISSDGSKILTACHDRNVRLWDFDAHELIATFKHDTRVPTADFSRTDGSRIVIEDNAARLWRPAAGQSVRIVEHEYFGDHEAVFTSNGRYILTRGEKETAIVCDAATRAPIGTPFWQPAGIFAVALTWQQRRGCLDELGGPPS